MNARRIPSIPKFRRSVSQAPAFTLIEMLVVLVVLAMLLVTATPVAMGVLRSSRLASSGEAMLGRLVEAQQMAIAQDTDVEVRIYQGIEPEFPGAPQWRAAQLFVLQAVGSAADPTSQGVFQPAGNPLRLDPSVIISSDVTLSSFLGLPLVKDTAASGNTDLSLTGHVAFHFHSDGSTDLTPGKPWFLTLIGLDPGPQTSPPDNYFTIQVDSSTGRVRSYHP
jgi:uncharacterized protein (TIGR02596 family)